jgi:nucleoside-diphosphate-sugar epimerase
LQAKQSNSHSNPLQEDLEHILIHTKGLWEEFRYQNIFITGGTGFFGRWLLESFAWANNELNLNASIVVLSRNPAAFAKKAPHLYQHKAIQLFKGDINNFVFPEGSFAYLIHNAVYQSPTDEKISNVSMVNEMIEGTKRILDFCIQAKVKKMLLISTGAIYGKAQFSREKIAEDSCTDIDPATSGSAYHQVRRIMETLAVISAEENAFAAKIARCFSFIGPCMPLNGRFAISDFISNSLSNKSITIKGDGKAVRSYLYMADLAIWLWTILVKGKSSQPYNVGSEIPFTIFEVADLFAKETDPHLRIDILGKPEWGMAADYYVPDTTRAKSELNLQQIISMNDAIKKTMQWYREHYLRKGAL